MIGDTIYLNPNYPNKQVKKDGVLKEELFLDKEECLHDFDFQAYCKDLEYSYRKTLELENTLNEIEEGLVEIDLEYFGLMCPCPQWATPENVELYNKSLGNENQIPMDSLFMVLVPENKETINPFDLEGWDEQEKIIFTFRGSFYKRKHYWIGEDGSYWYCRKFRYKNCDLKKIKQ